jgi:hypothetical protein
VHILSPLFYRRIIFFSFFCLLLLFLQLDKTLVGSPFLYAKDFNEIDVVEFSQWDIATNNNTHFVVQPWDNPGALYRFNTVGE